jgi:hypothetical protein
MYSRFITVLYLIILSTSRTFAQTPSGSSTNPDPSGSSTNPAPDATSFIGLENPLASGGVEDIPTLVEKILEIVLTIGVPIVAVMIIYSGYLFIKARGNPDGLKEAKKNLLGVLIGAAILLGAYVIAETVVNTINAIRGV